MTFEEQTKRYNELPQEIKGEMFKRHTHNDNGDIVYSECDVIELIEIALDSLKENQTEKPADQPNYNQYP